MRPLRALPAILLVLAALALASCGGGDDSASSDVSGPAAFAPADTPIYLEATLKPEGDQKANAEALLQKLGSVPLLGSQIDPDDLADQAVQQFDAAVGADVSYAEDVKPWLGGKAGIAIIPIGDTGQTSYVLSVETSDDDVARDSLARILEGQDNTQHSYDGVDYSTSANGIYSYGVFDGALVFSTTNQFEAAVDAEHGGDSLGASDDFQGAFEPLDEDGLASAYVDFDAAAQLGVGEDGDDAGDIEKARGLFPELFQAPLAAKLVAGENSVALDTSLAKPEDEPAFAASDRLSSAPSDSFAALGLDDAGGLFEVLVKRFEQTGEQIGDPDLSADSIDAAIEQRFGVSEAQIASALGDGVAYAEGDPLKNLSISVQLGLEGDSAASVANALLDGLEQTFESTPAYKVEPEQGGSAFTVSPADPANGSPLFPFLRVAADSGIASITGAKERADLQPSSSTSSLGSEPKFGDATGALGSDYEPLAYADLEPILDSIVGSFSLSGAVLGSTPPDQAIIQFVASKLDAAVAGTRSEGDRLVLRAATTLGG